MQELQISNGAAFLLNELADHEHISSAELIEQLLKPHKMEITKRDELKTFFKPYQKNMAEFKFNREDANE